MPDADPNRNIFQDKPTNPNGRERPYQARYVVDLGYAKSRLTVPLKTRDIKKAREYRDVVERTLHVASRAYQGLCP